MNKVYIGMSVSYILLHNCTAVSVKIYADAPVIFKDRLKKSSPEISLNH